MCSPVLLVDCLDEIQINSLDDYKNPNSPIYVKFVSQKVSQAALKSNIRANRSRQTNISASQKYSNKVHKRMNTTFITRREYQNDKEKFLEEPCNVTKSVNGQKA